MKLLNSYSIEFTSIPENVGFARVAISACASQLEWTLPALAKIHVGISKP